MTFCVFRSQSKYGKSFLAKKFDSAVRQ